MASSRMNFEKSPRRMPRALLLAADIGSVWRHCAHDVHGTRSWVMKGQLRLRNGPERESVAFTQWVPTTVWEAARAIGWRTRISFLPTRYFDCRLLSRVHLSCLINRWA